MKIKTAILLGSLSMGIFATGASAGNLVSAKDPDAILNIAKGYGSATLEKDSRNNPMIVGRIDGTRYGVFFMGCSDGQNCKDIQLVAAWKGIDVSMAQINSWNRAKPSGRAYLNSDGNPRLDMLVPLNHGVTQKNFDHTFKHWSITLTKFKEEVISQQTDN